MSIFKKSDVKNHLSVRDRNGVRLHPVSSVADATGCSGAESVRAEADPAAESSNQVALPSLKPVLVDATSKRERV
jgi:hypothetical protein